MILIATVWHSGTHSLIAEMGLKPDRKGKDWIQFHCNPVTLEKAQDCETHTTLRNPLEVAISWANRGRIFSLEHHRERTWYRQWKAWREICKNAVIHDVKEFNYKENSRGDELGLYEALQAGDLDKIFKHVPREYVEFAEDLTREVHGAKFVETHS